jgi:hypothetical protein
MDDRIFILKWISNYNNNLNYSAQYVSPALSMTSLSDLIGDRKVVEEYVYTNSNDLDKAVGLCFLASDGGKKDQRQITESELIEKLNELFGEKTQ